MITELERALTQLRGDYDRIRLELRQIEAGSDQLADWKAEAMAVASSWDVQAVGKLIGAQPGTGIRRQIEPFLRAIIAERDKLKAERKELESFIASLGFRV